MPPDTHFLRERDDLSIRQPPPPEEPASTGWTGTLADDPKPPVGSLVIETDDDGYVTVRTQQPDTPIYDETFDENLAERPELMLALSEIAEDILEGVEADLASRQGWVQNWLDGIDLLGLKIDAGASGKGRKKTSTVRDTTLLETIVKAQSQARGELLPASGPAKIGVVPNSTEGDDARATDFERDYNLCLTKGMPEYVPDLDRGLFSFFYGGNMFRMGYQCPILGRPRVGTISTEDLIVSEEATDLDTATRVTHRTPAMSPGEVKRRQYYKLWRDVDLTGGIGDTSPEKQKLSELSGVRASSTRPKDQPLCIYSTIADLDLTMHGLVEKGGPKGLPLPYKVTIEKYSRQVLRIERYWKDGDPRFLRKRRIVHYSMIPGFGFLAYGFLHLQGNQVKALTAIVRLLIDQMMFACFPGGAKAKGARTETNELDPAPGEWVDIGVPGGMDDIRKVMMPFPYKDLSPVAIQFYELLQKSAASVGAAAAMEVGEGRADIPVGTIMAMLEEKSKVTSAIHKRMHTAMSQELSMIKELFMERPETLAQVCPNPARQWSVAEEFADLNLIPASDPNLPSQVHRIMLATALVTLLGQPQASPLLNAEDILKRVLRMIGITDIESAMKPPPEPGSEPPDPIVQAAQATLEAKKLDMQSKAQENQRKAATETVNAQQKSAQTQQDAVNDAADRASKERIAKMQEDTELMRLHAEQARASIAMAHEHNKTTLDHLGKAADREADSQAQTAGPPRPFGGGQF